MGMSRARITDFMQRYFSAYSTVAQDPQQNHRMHAFYAPEVEIVTYLGEEARHGREDFMAIAASHPPIEETFTPRQFIIDEQQGMVSALLDCRMVERATGALLRQMSFMAHYQLRPEGDGSLRMTRLSIFGQYPRAGEPDLFTLIGETMARLAATSHGGARSAS